jgi:hypothetical protein
MHAFECVSELQCKAEESNCPAQSATSLTLPSLGLPSWSQVLDLGLGFSSYTLFSSVTHLYPDPVSNRYQHADLWTLLERLMAVRKTGGCLKLQASHSLQSFWMEGRIHIHMSVSCKTPRFGQLGLGGWGNIYRTLPCSIYFV